MKYRAKRDFLGVTKGMEFPVDKDGEIEIDVDSKIYLGVSTWLDPTKYPDDFELVEEPKYTDSDLDLILNEFTNLTREGMFVSFYHPRLKQVITELKLSKERK